jgi:hypothetical protein
VGCSEARAALGAALAVALLLAVGVAEVRGEPPAEGACQAWPGEITPLPSTDDSDPFLAAWAERRAAELAAHARALEARSRALALPLWLHAACLAPRSAELAEAGREAHPVRVYRPPLVATRQDEAPRPTAVLDAPLSLPRTAALPPARERRPPPPPPRAAAPRETRPPTPAAEPSPPAEPAPAAEPQPSLPPALAAEPIPPPAVEAIPPPPPAPLPAPAVEALAETERALFEARFEDALAWAARGRAAFTSAPSAPRERARLEVLAATAALALGREEEARRAAGAALAAEPGLELDPVRHSPKVVSLFESVRSGEEGAP